MNTVNNYSESNKRVKIQGRNVVIGTGWEELYQYDQAIDWIATMGTTTGFVLQVTSSSTSDAAAGTGAQQIEICGVDANLVFQSEVITMNGQTIVSTTKFWRAVYSAEVIRTGSGKVNAGDIHIVKTGTGGTYTAGVPGTLTSALCRILIGFNESHNGIYVVPAGKKARLEKIEAIARSQGASVAVWYQNMANTSPLYRISPLLELGANSPVLSMGLDGVEIPELSLIRIRALGAVASAVVAATLDLSLVS